MRIAYVQFDPIFGEIETNLRRIETLVADVAADLFVLPELCTTGYLFMLPEEVAHLAEEAPDGKSTAFFEEMCRVKMCSVVFGMAERHRNHFFNSAVLVSPEGYMGTYRKTHLYGTEKKVFRRGDTGFRVWQLGAVRIGVMICFDWFFPESMRVLMLRGAHLVCHAANLVLPYCQAAMVTRCLENGVFAITANRTGRESRSGVSLSFTGASQIVDHGGVVLARAPAEGDHVQVVEVDPLQAADKALGVANHRIQDRCPSYYGEICACG
ncbi:acyltransferase [bacterium]|nr:acyltransferase [candidate division CSSED10-310 bacterium]